MILGMISCGSGGSGSKPISTNPLDLKPVITQYSIKDPNTGLEESGIITDNNIAVSMPYGTDINNLVAEFVTTGTKVIVNDTIQTSGTTPNNFANPVTYTVYGVNGSYQNYIVTVTTQPTSFWIGVGNPGFSESAVYNTTIAFNPTTNQPYIAYSDGGHSYAATVMRYDGTNWMPVGSPGFSFAGALYTSIAFNPANNQPYVAYSDYTTFGNATVMTFESNNWTPVGNILFSAGQANYINIAFKPSNNQPYVVYSDSGSSGNATVMQLDSNSNTWIPVGSPGFSAGEADYTDIAFDQLNNQPYVVYQDFGNSLNATVMKFDANSSTWIPVGSPGFSQSIAFYTSIAFNPSNNQPYVVYSDGDSGKATVMKFNGESWVYVGKRQFSAGQANFTSIVFNPSNNQPYVVYSDGNSGKATVMAFNGTSWINAGNSDFSSSQALFTSIGFNQLNNEPYVVYSDGSSENKATVMKLPN